MHSIRIDLLPSPRPLADILWAERQQLVLGTDPVDLPAIRSLILQGSVWAGPRRLKFPDQAVSSADTPCLTVNLPQKPIARFLLDPRLVCHEDDDLLAVWKPQEVNTCPSVFSDWDCLSAGVQDYLAARGSSHLVNTIHRLDRAVRGLVLFGKHPAAEAWLYRIFAQRRIQKFYLAACPLPEPCRPHYRLEGDQEHRGKVRWTATRIHLLDRAWSIPGVASPLARFLACPQTGRPHQIRKHFAAHLAPLQGDAAYGGYSPQDRLELACVAYRYLHPSGQWRYLRVQDPWLDRQ